MNKDILQQVFQKNIIQELGIESLSDEKKEEILAAVTDLIGLRLMVRVNDRLPESEHDAFTVVTETKNFEDLMDWLNSKGVPFEEMIVEEVAKAKIELKAHSDKIK